MIVELKDVTKTYMRGNRAFNAVDHVNFQMEKGAYVTIIGRSGSGKTTLLSMISGMITPSSGQLCVGGVDVAGKTDAELSHLRNATIGFIPQNSAILPNLDVLDNVCLPFFIGKHSGDPFGRGQYLLEMLGIPHLAQAYPRELSGGEQRRVLIARALMNAPDILIADEPTSDLDVENTQQVMTLFQKINGEGTTVLIVSHELDTLSYGKKTYTMKEGQLLEGKHL